MLRRFVIHDHYASHRHHDLRLEMYGTLRSWAIPKLFPLTKDVKRLAIQVEDHSLGYINFRGRIAEGKYGAGIVKIFDKGDYEIVDKDADHYKIVFHGKKAGGVYILRMFKNNWLLWKV